MRKEDRIGSRGVCPEHDMDSDQEVASASGNALQHLVKYVRVVRESWRLITVETGSMTSTIRRHSWDLKASTMDTQSHGTFKHSRPFSPCPVRPRLY